MRPSLYEDADGAGLPADREFRAALDACTGWAVEPVTAHPEPDAQVPDDLLVPRWSRDGLQRP